MLNLPGAPSLSFDRIAAGEAMTMSATSYAETTMRTKTPSWLTLYVGMAILTAVFQIWVRSSQCTGLFDCGLSYAKGIVWATIWPMSWIVYIVGII